jgi:hypothetical protein
MMRAELVRFVRDECGGDTKVAAERMGVSVSYILAIAPELKTDRQSLFDAVEANYREPTGATRGELNRCKGK